MAAVAEITTGAARENGHARRVRVTKERILAAASEAFAREGYGATTIEAIAEAAGTAPASVYNHFDSKAGVAQALAEDALAAHDRYVAAAWALEVSPLERLIAAAGAVLAFALEQPTLFQAMSLSYLRPLGLFPGDTAAAAAIGARREQQLGRVVTNIEEAIDAGELAAIDVQATSRFVMASLAGVLTIEARSGRRRRSRGHGSGRPPGDHQRRGGSREPDPRGSPARPLRARSRAPRARRSPRDGRALTQPARARAAAPNSRLRNR